jgi:hypothetical protein
VGSEIDTRRWLASLSTDNQARIKLSNRKFSCMDLVRYILSICSSRKSSEEIFCYQFAATHTLLFGLPMGAR